MEEIQKYIKDGRIIQMPRKWESKEKLFIYVASFFDAGQEYTEKEVNEILKEHYSDYALLRRYLVDFNLLMRSPDGITYRRVEGKILS